MNHLIKGDVVLRLDRNRVARFRNRNRPEAFEVEHEHLWESIFFENPPSFQPTFGFTMVASEILHPFGLLDFTRISGLATGVKPHAQARLRQTCTSLNIARQSVNVV